MIWHKYTIDEWLEQFGAWCEQCTMKGGHLPDGLHINNIYWLMQSVNPSNPNNKAVRVCEISDDEAMAVNKLLCRAMKVLPKQIELVVLHKVQGQSLRQITCYCNLSHNQIRLQISNGMYYLLGLISISP